MKFIVSRLKGGAWGELADMVVDIKWCQHRLNQMRLF